MMELLFGEGEIHADGLTVYNGYIEGLASQSLVPDFQDIGAWGDIWKNECPFAIGNGVVGVFLHDDPSLHPTMHVTCYFEDLGF